MTLKQWAANGWLKEHRSSSEEIGNLLAIVERDLKDASEGLISADWRFGIAYNAVLKLCAILLPWMLNTVYLRTNLHITLIRDEPYKKQAN